MDLFCLLAFRYSNVHFVKSKMGVHVVGMRRRRYDPDSACVNQVRFSALVLDEILTDQFTLLLLLLRFGPTLRKRSKHAPTSPDLPAENSEKEKKSDDSQV